MRPLVAVAARLQGSQVSVQALTRLGSVYVFLLASWADSGRLAVVALQGALLAIPYTLMEALLGRPLSAGLVPGGWQLRSWAWRVTAAVFAPVAVVGYLCATVALPQTGPVDRLVLLVPVLLQLPLEALFWVTTRTGGVRWANLIPQATAVGTLLAGVVFVVLDLRLDVVAVPAQLAVLGWVLLRRPAVVPGQVRPPVARALRLGAVYCVAAAVDLAYTVSLPAVAGAVVGPAALVVLRGLDLLFGPFHVALSASVRQDVVAGRAARWRTGARALTMVSLAGVGVVVLASGSLRAVVADELATVAVGVLALYCAYKALLAGATWLSTRHMIWAPPRRYLVSAVGSRVIAFGGLACSVAWVDGLAGLVGQLLVAEALVVCWFLARIRARPPAPAPRRWGRPRRAASDRRPAGPPPAPRPAAGDRDRPAPAGRTPGGPPGSSPGDPGPG
ncbi:hypothetical protein GA0070617_1483 [Micromonospora yangpuensis]|uniref:Membrane protein involved in the export of O-antigen and teichoic acid n=1 Tax=Micromonospora yangpuensis TaxID=683228 RepID=A0A1C6U8V3_9ACTN|nr:hypothetical protein GA0070617_1483 [Micromonospora yangpuensis]